MEWDNQNCGRSRKYKDTFWSNPQLSLTLGEHTELYACVSLPDKRVATGACKYKAHIGLYVFRVDNNAVNATGDDGAAMAFHSRFVRARDNACEFSLDAGRYIVVASTYKRRIKSKYWVSMYAPKDIM